MESTFKLFVAMLRRISRIWEIANWERAARRALRDYDYRGAELAQARAHELSRGI